LLESREGWVLVSRRRGFFVGRGMCERRAPSTPFSRGAGDVFDVSLNFSPSLNDLPDFLTMSE